MEGLGEVDLRLALGGDGERGHGQVERAVGDAVQQPVERRLPELIIIAQLPGDLIPELDTDPAPLALGALDREGRGILGADGEGAGGGVTVRRIARAAGRALLLRSQPVR